MNTYQSAAQPAKDGFFGEVAMNPNAQTAIAIIALILLVLITHSLDYRDQKTQEAVYIQYMSDVKKAQENRNVSK